MTVTIVLPVRHDPRTESAVRRSRAFASRFGVDSEVITCGELLPGTYSSADRHVSVKPAHKGRCVRAGVLASRGRAILVLDADVPVDDQDLFAVLKTTASADFVIANRGKGARRPLARRIVSTGYKCIVRWLFGVADLDVQSGVKGFTAAVGRRLLSDQTVKGLGYDLEVVLKAMDEGLHIEQVPVEASHHSSTLWLWQSVPCVLSELLLFYFRRRWNGPRTRRGPTARGPTKRFT